MEILTNKFDLTDSFRAKGKLVKVQTSIWGGKKQDQSLSATVSKSVKGNENSFKVQKCLIDEERIKELRGLDRQRRNSFNTHVCMWDREWQLLPNQNEDRIKDIWNDFQNQFQDKKDKIISDYPDLIEQAKTDLGSAFNEEDYPCARELEGGTVQVQIGGDSQNPIMKDKIVKGKFHANIFFEQIPDLQITDTSGYYQSGGISSLIGNVAYNSHEYYEDKLIELNERNKKDLVTVIGGFANSISGYDKSNKKGKYFKNSVVDNLVKELNGLKGKNTFFENEHFDDIISEVKKVVGKTTAEELREDDSLREDVADKVSKLATKSSDLFS
tara:strand:+ start:788 stop:1771 length:984 start_codon:yes stop_codon:yes gene_type:complete